MKEYKTMAELHKIRERIYEETKNMPPEEVNAWYDMRAEPVMREFGIKTLAPSPQIN